MVKDIIELETINSYRSVAAEPFESDCEVRGGTSLLGKGIKIELEPGLIIEKIENGRDNEVRFSITDFCKAHGKEVIYNPITGEKLGEGPDYKLSPTLAAETVLKNYTIAISEEQKNNPKATIYMWDGNRWVADAENMINNKIYEIIGDLAYTKGLNEMRNRIVSNAQVLKFDADLEIINLKNGRYNWRTGEFIEHSPDDPYPSLIQHPINYDHIARSTKIPRILEKLTPDEIFQQTLKEWIAYCFYKHYLIKKALMLYGPGGTGKSIFTELEDNLIGAENSDAISFDRINKNNFAMSGLKNKCRNNCGETPATEVSAFNNFKALTGRDQINSDVKYKDPIQFYNFAKIEVMLNEVFKTKDTTDAFYFRWLIIPLLHKFTDEEKRRDAELLKAIRDPEELSGFFNEVIALLPGLIDRQAFSYNPSASEIEAQFNLLSEPMKEFYNKFITEDPDDKVGKKYLYEKYVIFSKVNNTKPNNKINFDNFIKKLLCIFKYDNNCKKRHGKENQMAWPGISLDEEALEKYLYREKEGQQTLS